jgi:WD40 repeat protein
MENTSPPPLPWTIKALLRFGRTMSMAKYPTRFAAIQGKLVFSITPEERKKLETYVTAQPQLLGSWDIKDAAVYSIAMDSDGRIAAGSTDGKIRVWGIADKAAIADFDATPQREASQVNTQALIASA